MNALKNLIPISTDAGTWALLAACAAVLAAVGFSVWLPWVRNRRDQRRIDRGEYDYRP